MKTALSSVYAKKCIKTAQICEDVTDFRLKVEVMSFLHTREANNKKYSEMF